MTYVPRGRVSSRNKSGRRGRDDGYGRSNEGRSGGNDSGSQSRDGGRGGNSANGRSGRAAGPQRNTRRRHTEADGNRAPRRDAGFENGNEAQPRPEHVEYGNGARRPSQRRGYGRGRGNARPQQEHLGNRLPPEERMLPDDYGNRIDDPAPGNRRASSQRPERPQRGQRPQRSGRDAQGTGRSERGQRGRSDRQPRISGDYMDEQPAPRFVDRERDGGQARSSSNDEQARGRGNAGRSSANDEQARDRGRGGRSRRSRNDDRPAADNGGNDGSRGRRRSAGGTGAETQPRERRPRVQQQQEQEQRGSGNKRSRAKEQKLELDILAFIRDNPVVHEIEQVFEPQHMFADFGLNRRLLTNVEERGYEAPTPIQDVAIPPVRDGRDVVGLANTGTGKTAAFLLPLIDRMLADERQYALVLAPTRELAIQIEEELQSFTRGLGMRSTVIVGGVGEGAQLRNLRKDNRFIIATPGRLIDFIKRGEISLAGINNVVLDEADRMLDMGFIRDMRFIIGKLPRERQTLFFSATMSEEIRQIIGEFLHDPVTVSVVRHRTAANVKQEVISLEGRKRFEMLVDMLRQPEMKRVLVFGRTKHGMNKLSRLLNREGLETDAIHGNKSHNARQLALRRFKEGSIQALVATDVAARGLDIDDVSHVINFELPQSYDDYIHRIGRTGRAGRTGHAITFVE